MIRILIRASFTTNHKDKAHCNIVIDVCDVCLWYVFFPTVYVASFVSEKRHKYRNFANNRIKTQRFFTREWRNSFLAQKSAALLFFKESRKPLFFHKKLRIL